MQPPSPAATDTEATARPLGSDERAGLREPGGVLLISSYELGHQPLGLALPMAFLERAGFAPRAIDLSIEPLDEAAVRRARLVGFSVPMHTATRIAMRAADKARAWNPEAHRCFYGLYAPLNREVLRAPDADGRPLADSVLGGEHEEALCDLLRALEAGDGGDVDDAARRLGEAPLVRLRFPAPSRAGLAPLDRYARLLRGDGSEAVAGYTEATRGCLHKCNHCPIPAVYGGRFFAVPVEVVLEDVRRQAAAGAAHVTLGDPDFFNGPRHALAVARAIHAELPSLTWDATIKIEHLVRHRALLPELGRLGCLFVTTAVESLSERVLEVLDKRHTRADVVTALGALRGAGIAPRPTWVPFTPWGTLDEHLALFDFLDEEQLWTAVDPVQLTIRLLVPPGSLLLAHPAMVPHLVPGPLDGASLSHRWVHPDPRMDELQRRSAALVAHAAERGHAPELTFASLRGLALAAAGRAPAPSIRFPSEGAPRLSESWFC